MEALVEICSENLIWRYRYPYTCVYSSLKVSWRQRALSPGINNWLSRLLEAGCRPERMRPAPSMASVNGRGLLDCTVNRSIGDRSKRRANAALSLRTYVSGPLALPRNTHSLKSHVSGQICIDTTMKIYSGLRDPVSAGRPIDKARVRALVA